MISGSGVVTLVRVLWEDSYFSTEKTIGNTMLELKRKGYNIEFDEIYSALKGCEFILTKFKELEDSGISMPSFVQRYPPPTAMGASEIIYSKGYAYDFYKNIKEILSNARRKVAISDSYVSEELVTLYFDNLPDDVEILILTSEQENREKEKFFEIAKKFAMRPRKRLEVRASADCHDRMIFVDDDAWVCGSAVKDAGRKPTYLIKIRNVEALRSIFRPMWDTARKMVESQ